MGLGSICELFSLLYSHHLDTLTNQSFNQSSATESWICILISTSLSAEHTLGEYVWTLHQSPCRLFKEHPPCDRDKTTRKHTKHCQSMFFPSAHPQLGTGTKELLDRGGPHAATMIPTPNP